MQEVWKKGTGVCVRAAFTLSAFPLLFEFLSFSISGVSVCSMRATLG